MEGDILALLISVGKLNFWVLKQLGLHLFSFWCFIYYVLLWQAEQQKQWIVLRFYEPIMLWKYICDEGWHILQKGYVSALNFLHNLQFNRYARFCSESLWNAVIYAVSPVFTKYIKTYMCTSSSVSTFKCPGTKPKLVLIALKVSFQFNF